MYICTYDIVFSSGYRLLVERKGRGYRGEGLVRGRLGLCWGEGKGLGVVMTVIAYSVLRSDERSERGVKFRYEVSTHVLRTIIYPLTMEGISVVIRYIPYTADMAACVVLF